MFMYHIFWMDDIRLHVKTYAEIIFFNNFHCLYFVYTYNLSLLVNYSEKLVRHFYLFK